MKPLFLLTNDDGYQASGLSTLIDIARGFGDVVVMAPEKNASGQSHSFTVDYPLYVSTVVKEQGLSVHYCNGKPVDCVKLGVEHFCSRRPDMLLSGINHGSNSSINILYSGTMGAALEAATIGIPAIGFSLLDHSADADFSKSVPFVSAIIDTALKHTMPIGSALNVNIPAMGSDKPKGIKVCRQSRASWLEAYNKVDDEQGLECYLLAGRFQCDDNGQGTDQWALENGYVSIVPITTDFTDTDSLRKTRRIYESII
jgi:5'-nucleotidase